MSPNSSFGSKLSLLRNSPLFFVLIVKRFWVDCRSCVLKKIAGPHFLIFFFVTNNCAASRQILQFLLFLLLNYILLLCTTPLFYNVNQWHEWKCWMRNKKGFVLPKNFCLLLFLKWTHACTQNEVNRCMSPDLARCEKYQKLRLLRKNYTLCFRPAAAGSIFIQGWNIARTERAWVFFI